MNRGLMMYLLGSVSAAMAASLFLPIAYCLYEGSSEGIVFLVVFLFVAASSAGLIVRSRQRRRQVSVKDAACFVFLLWFWLSFLGMLPFLASGQLGPVEAVFESVSALTTTGASLLPPDAPYVMQLWRGILAWFGGMCFLMLLVTAMQQASGCFGLTLAFRKGMSFSAMLKPMAYLSVQMLGVYGGITALSVLLYALSGLSPMDALLAAMLTVSTTGGRDVLDWFGEDGNPWPECTAAFTMLLVCGNLLRYWRTFRRREFGDYYRNPETKVFLATVAFLGTFMAWHLWYSGSYGLAAALRHAFFHVLSFASTTGFATSSIMDWPDPDLFFLFLLAFMGGCMGSPTGGLKVIRFLVLFKLLAIEARRSLHPHMIATVVVGKDAVPAKIAGRILGFFFLYVVALYLFVLVLSLSGIHMSEAVGIAIAGFTSLGSSLGLADSAVFLSLPAPVKLLACLFMLLARVEIFAFLLLVQICFGKANPKW